MTYKYFFGCVIPGRLPYLEASARKIFDKLGINVSDQTQYSCCPDPTGVAALDHKSWLALGARNLSEDCTINFIIWDIGGQITQMAPYRSRFYHGTNTVFIVLDRTKRSTLDGINKWYKDMKNTITDIKKIPIVIIGNKSDLIENIEITSEDMKNTITDIKKIPIVIIGNKSDLIENIEITSEDMKRKAEEYGFHFIETSAKTGENVSDAFNYIAYRIMERI
ncbi:unnamed protein product [marine sediment metagenome]|uniref:Uncharacterized protein n=1 Tax=marine sediment metagenome TaxID=412755 RepID=X0YJV8_9ZZZZ